VAATKAGLIEVITSIPEELVEITVEIGRAQINNSNPKT